MGKLAPARKAKCLYLSLGGVLQTPPPPPEANVTRHDAPQSSTLPVWVRNCGIDRRESLSWNGLRDCRDRHVLEVRWWSDERAGFHLTNERDSSCIDPWNGHFAAHKGFAVPRQAWLKVGLLCLHLTELRVDEPLGKPNLVVDLMCAFPSLVILSVHIRLVFNHPNGWFACPLYPDGMPVTNTMWKATDKDNTIPRLRVLLYNRSVAKRLPEHLQIIEVLTSCCDVVHYRRCCKYQTRGGRGYVSAAGFLACCLDVFPSLKTILTDAPLAAIDSDAYPSFVYA